MAECKKFNKIQNLNFNVVLLYKILLCYNADFLYIFLYIDLFLIVIIYDGLFVHLPLS